MVNNKLFRHAQTQHGDDTFDLENIVLCKANLISPVVDQSELENFKLNNDDKNVKCNTSDNEPENLKENEKSSLQNETNKGSDSQQCVWFFDVEDVETIKNDKVST